MGASFKTDRMSGKLIPFSSAQRGHLAQAQLEPRITNRQKYDSTVVPLFPHSVDCALRYRLHIANLLVLEILEYRKSIGNDI
jgi:hypothetical protein